MIVLKYIYVILVAFYICIIAVWCMRYSLSYKIVGVKSDLIEERSLTHEKHKAIQNSFEIRQSFSKILLYTSFFTFIASFFFLRNKWFKQVTVVKAIMISAGVIVLILMLVNGIHFIPSPPIR
jgi:hypothetical protein